MLGLSLHGWENAMVVSLIIAGFFALIAGAATWAVIRLQRIELAGSKMEFDSYKLDTAKHIADANAAGDAARAEAAKANKSAEDEKFARVKLEAKLAPRRLDTPQWQAIRAALISFAGKTVRIESYGLDAEAAILGFQLRDAFKSANLNVDETGLMTRASGGSIALGVHVTGSDKALVQAILSALETAHLKSSPDEPFPGGGISFGMMIPATPPNAVVFVGIKPLTE